MDLEFLKKVVTDQYLETDDNIVSVGWGFKYVNGEITDERCLSYTVEKKIPINEIPEENRIPKEITISGVTFTTDIIEGEIRPTQTFQYCDQYTLNWDAFLGNPYTLPQNRLISRPLKGGVSSINYTRNRGYVCTMGFIAVDNDTNSLVGVSNNHCYVHDAFFVSQRNPNGYRENEVGSIVIQPADGGQTPTNGIGVVKKYVPISSTGLNRVDGAITTLKQSDINPNESWKQVGLNIPTPMPFATTSEINALQGLTSFNNSPNLFSAGRTTGPKGESTLGSCRLKIDAFPVTIGVGYNRQNSSVVATFEDQIRYRLECPNYPNLPTCPYPLQGGDSGSALLYETQSGERKILGLVYACSGRINTQINRFECMLGFANRIDHVANELNIRAWLGESNINYSETTSIETICSPQTSSKTIVVNGKTYWQLGFCPPLS